MGHSPYEPAKALPTVFSRVRNKGTSIWQAKVNSSKQGNAITDPCSSPAGFRCAPVEDSARGPPGQGRRGEAFALQVLEYNGFETRRLSYPDTSSWFFFYHYPHPTRDP